MKALLRMTFRDQRWSIFGWSLGLGALGLLVVATFPAIEGKEEFDQLWQELPEGIRELFGGSDSITQLPGYLDSQLIALMPLLLGIYALMHASRALAGAEEEKRLDVLLAAPVRRGSLVVAHAITMVVSQVLVAAAVGGLLALGVLAFGIEGNLWWIVASSLDAVPASLFVGFLTLAASAVVHRRRAASAIGTVFVIASYFLAGLAPLVAELRPLRWGSIFTHYGESRPLYEGLAGLDWLYYVVCVVGIIVFLSVAVWRFDAKDLTG